MCREISERMCKLLFGPQVTSALFTENGLSIKNYSCFSFCFFNITFYQPSNWSTVGKYYRENTRNKNIVLGKSAFFYEMGTASVCFRPMTDLSSKLIRLKVLAKVNPYCELISDDRAWTLLEVHSYPVAKSEVRGPLNLSEAIFKCLKLGLMDASNASEQLTKAFEDFLGISSKSMVARETDLDLFEDANFSKSRRYF